MGPDELPNGGGERPRRFLPGWRTLWPPLAWAVLFGVAHTQAPLYFSNQNQYFLHGLAAGGLGYLDHDWLANTADPTPVFSAGVALTYRLLGEWPFQAYFFLLLMLYFLSLVRLCDALPGTPRSGLARFALLTLLVAVHAAIFRWGSVELFGKDYPWFLQSGLAGQYLLGPGVQPSAFGVLLLTSVAVFATGRPFLAALCSCAAAIIHPTYLLTAAILTLTYMAVLAREERWRSALLLGAGSLLAVSPVVAYNLWQFAPASAAQFAEAQHILADVRIPHHSDISRWLDVVAVCQIAWMVLGVALARRSRFFPLLLMPALATLALTLLQVATGSRMLALLFPWRTSAVLVPAATAVILARAVAAAEPWLRRSSLRELRIAYAGFGALLLLSVGGGVAVTALGLGYRGNEEELAPMDFVRATKQPGEVYLIPVNVPKLGYGPRGSVSTSFTPPPRPSRDGHLIPVDLQRFRLWTGEPIFVDFKSVPYKDTEVLEWYRRVRLCQGWYALKRWDESVLDELAREGITHVLTTAERDPAEGVLPRIYAEGRYRIYRLPRRRKTEEF